LELQIRKSNKVLIGDTGKSDKFFTAWNASAQVKNPKFQYTLGLFCISVHDNPFPYHGRTTLALPAQYQFLLDQQHRTALVT
jgi:hypothetical protein